MKLENEKFLTVSSNIFFVIPFIFAIINNEIILAFLIAGVIVFSTFYHLVKSPGIDWWWNTGRTWPHFILLIFDTLFAFTTIIYAILEIRSDDFTPMVYFSIFTFILGCISYVIPNKNNIYEFSHSMWHFFCAVAITLLAISEYLIKN